MTEPFLREGFIEDGIRGVASKDTTANESVKVLKGLNVSALLSLQLLMFLYFSLPRSKKGIY